MSKEANIQLHKNVILRARKLPVASNRRIELINRSVTGILRALHADYNESHI